MSIAGSMLPTNAICPTWSFDTVRLPEDCGKIRLTVLLPSTFSLTVPLEQAAGKANTKKPTTKTNFFEISKALLEIPMYYSRFNAYLKTPKVHILNYTIAATDPVIVIINLEYFRPI